MNYKQLREKTETLTHRQSEIERLRRVIERLQVEAAAIEAEISEFHPRVLSPLGDIAGVAPRTLKALEKAGYTHIYQLMGLSRLYVYLPKIKGVSADAMRELSNAIAVFVGVKFGGELWGR